MHRDVVPFYPLSQSNTLLGLMTVVSYINFVHMRVLSGQLFISQFYMLQKNIKSEFNMDVSFM